MDILSLLGVAFGAGGLIIGVYQYKKQQKMEKRLERKEELREFADILEDLHEPLTKFESDLRESGEGSQFWHDARNFFKEYTAHLELSGSFPDTEVSVFRYVEDGKRVDIEDSSEFMHYTKNGDMPTIALELQGVDGHSTDQTFVFLDRAFAGGAQYLYRINALSQEHSDYVDEFSPDLITAIEDKVHDIIQKCVDESFRHSPSCKIYYEDCDSIDEWANWVVDELLMYEGIEDDLDELSDLMEELEDTRKRALQTSYS